MLFEDQIHDAKEVFLKAAQDGNTFLFDTLLEPLSSHVKITEIIDPQHGGNALHWAANNGHLEIVKRLTGKFPELINSQTSNGSTPLLNAVISNHEGIVTYLLQQNANPLITNQNQKNAFTAATDKPDNNPIKIYLAEYRAVLNKNFIAVIKNEPLELAGEWLDKDADNFIDAYDEDEQIEDAGRWLDRGADIEVPIRKSSDKASAYTALFHACSIGNDKLAAFLIDRKANLNVIGAKNGFSPLHAAAFFGHLEIVKLLRNANATLSTKDANNNTPLDIAKSRGPKGIIELLEVKEEQKATPQRYTKASSCLESVDALDKTNNNSFPFANNTESNLMERFNRLRGNSYVPNSVFGQKAQSIENIKKNVTLEEIRQVVKLFSAHIEQIENAGKPCIKSFNAKCTTEEMRVNTSEFDEYLASVKKSIKKLHEAFFATDDIADIMKAITKDYGLANTIARVAAGTNNTYGVLHNKIIPSYEYGKEYSILTREMIALEQDANKLKKIITKIHKDKIELISEVNKFKKTI